MALRASDVFTPGSFPDYTYIQRANLGLEQSLRDSLGTIGEIVALSGPSKSGKTVLVEKVVGQKNLVTVTGASIKSTEDLWNEVLDWLDVPSQTSSDLSVEGEVGAEVTAKGSVGVPFVAKGEAGVTGKVGATVGTDRGTQRERRGLQEVVKQMAGTELVILVDDFHYVEKSIREDIAKAVKEAVRLKVKIVMAAVSHRGDDVIRANSELRGRVRMIDLDYWQPDELAEIAHKGFEALKLSLAEDAITVFTAESAGSPQLMQLLCRETCFVLNKREAQTEERIIPLVLSKPDEARILEQTSSRTDFRTLVDVLDAGPPTRGTKRNIFTFKDGTKGDVYRAVLKSVAADPPRLSFPYDGLLERAVAICEGESPAGSSVTSTCVHMSRLAAKFPNERAIEWDEDKQVLDVPDPYFVFYLRWSRRLFSEQKQAKETDTAADSAAAPSVASSTD